MRSVELETRRSLPFTLAADARLPGSEYCNDQIWRAGLRQRRAACPRLADHLRLAGALHAPFPALHPRMSWTLSILPALPKRLLCAVLSLITCTSSMLHLRHRRTSEVWVPTSQSLCGRFAFTNQGAEPASFRFDWVAQLNPTEGERMAPLELQGVSVLAGQSADLRPGGLHDRRRSPAQQPLSCLVPRRSSWRPAPPAASPGARQRLPDVEASFNLARQLAARPFDADIARLELLNAGQVEIFTGNPDWDAALALSQSQAYSLVHRLRQPGCRTLPSSSPASPTRASPRVAMAAIINHLWNGQPALDAYYLSTLLLPGGAPLLQGVLRNYLAAGRRRIAGLETRHGRAAQPADGAADPRQPGTAHLPAGRRPGLFAGDSSPTCWISCMPGSALPTTPTGMASPNGIIPCRLVWKNIPSSRTGSPGR